MIFQKSIICCDIQPVYSLGLTFELSELIKYLNNFDNILYLFNNKDIGVSDTKESVISMLKDAGANDDLISKINFRPKVFFYFRDLLDYSNYDSCKKLLKMLILRGVDFANELSYNDIKSCGFSDKKANLILAGDFKFWHDFDLESDLLQYSGAELIGGFQNQCFKEIKLYLDAIGITYKENPLFIY